MQYKQLKENLAQSGTNVSFPPLRTFYLSGACCFALIISSCSGNSQTAQKPGDSTGVKTTAAASKDTSIITPAEPTRGPLDTALYNKKLAQLANGDSSGRWPVKTAYPIGGAILPFKRIVAYYGNFYSKKMGVLGEYPPDEMLKRLGAEIKKWEAADTSTPVLPALHYIAATAQGSPGKDGKYRLRMPSKQIDSVINLAARI